MDVDVPAGTELLLTINGNPIDWSGGNPPNPSGWEPPSWLRTDTDAVAKSTAPNPAYNTPWQDPVFKSKIIRVSGNPGSAIKNISGGKWGAVVRHAYNTDQAWNADQSLLYLPTNKDGGGIPADLFLHGENYDPQFAAARPYQSDIRWHHSDPNLFYFIKPDGAFGTWDPKAAKQETSKTFTGYTDLRFGPWKGNFTEDGSKVCITGTKNGVSVAFVYDVKTGEKGNDLRDDDYGSGGATVKISSKGNYLFWGYDPDITIITDLDGNKVTTLPNNYISHADTITDGNGDECIVGRVNDGNIGQGKSGLINKYRCSDGQRTPLTTAGWVDHTSCRAQKSHRWCIGAASVDRAPYIGELLMAELDGSKVYRLAHTHVPATPDYDAQPQASHSPDGGRAIFATAWNGTGTAPRPVGAYVVDFRS